MMGMDSSDALVVDVRCIGADGRFLEDYTGRGADMSPNIVLSGVDDSAQSLAVVLEDVTHPIFGSMTHWLVWNLDPNSPIPEGIPAGARVSGGAARQGIGYGIHRYRGPKPPRGRTHRYRFTVYVLDSMLDIPSSSRRRRFEKAISGHVVQQASVEALYE